VYLSELLLGPGVEGQEGLFFLADKHETVVIIILIVCGQLHIGDHVIVELVLL